MTPAPLLVIEWRCKNCGRDGQVSSIDPDAVEIGLAKLIDRQHQEQSGGCGGTVLVEMRAVRHQRLWARSAAAAAPDSR